VASPAQPFVGAITKIYYNFYLQTDHSDSDDGAGSEENFSENETSPKEVAFAMKKKQSGKALKRKMPEPEHSSGRHSSGSSNGHKTSRSIPDKVSPSVSNQEETSSHRQQVKKIRQEKHHSAEVVKTAEKDEEGKKEEIKKEDYKNDVWNDRLVLT
jgi:hypothetical protein